MYKEQYLETKLKSYDGKITTDFYDNDNKISKEGCQCFCQLIIVADAVHLEE